MRPLEQDSIANFWRTNCPRRKYASGLLELGFPNLREGNPLHMTLQKDDFDLNLIRSCLGNLRRTSGCLTISNLHGLGASDCKCPIARNQRNSKTANHSTAICSWAF